MARRRAHARAFEGAACAAAGRAPRARRASPPRCSSPRRSPRAAQARSCGLSSSASTGPEGRAGARRRHGCHCCGARSARAQSGAGAAALAVRRCWRLPCCACTIGLAWSPARIMPRSGSVRCGAIAAGTGPARGRRGRGGALRRYGRQSASGGAGRARAAMPRLIRCSPVRSGSRSMLRPPALLAMGPPRG